MRTPYHFFLKHVGFSRNPQTQTPMQGRIACAKSLAAAESLFIEATRVADIGIAWENDPDGWSDFQCDKRAGRHEGADPETCESAVIWHRDVSGDVHYLASLGAIWDADSNYRRVIRAELASECADALRAIVERG